MDGTRHDLSIAGRIFIGVVKLKIEVRIVNAYSIAAKCCKKIDNEKL